jgi:hypothetical protein
MIGAMKQAEKKIVRKGEVFRVGPEMVKRGGIVTK